ncbi:MAG: hypothetical protein IEMM0002_0839 [bacterium]|nr:MAG: hypothetical protein IEMM0002_0839 [bacterium]
MMAKNKKIVIYDKDDKARRIIDIMCRKIGLSSIVDVESMKAFNAALVDHVDKASGLSGLVGKGALPKLDIDLFIVDWDSPPNTILALIKNLKSKYSGKYRFLVVAESQHASAVGKALKVGASEVIIKPFSQSDFREKVEDILLGKEQMVVKSFNLTAASGKSKKAGYGVNPFALDTGKDKPKPRTDPEKTNVQIAASAEPDKKEVKKSPQVKPLLEVSESTGRSSRSSFYGRGENVVRRGDKHTATLIDGKIDGHYHEKVNVIGGGENCYWAKETESDKVRLEYLNAKGNPTGVEAKVVGKEDFMYSFYLCEEHGCGILKRLGKFPEEQVSN